MEGVCSIPECGNPRHARIYCNKHYRRFLNGGLEGLKDKQDKQCEWCKETFSVDISKAKRTSFCSKSCQLNSYKSTVKNCKVEGCANKASTNRMQLCLKHRSRQYKHGDTATLLRVGKYPKNQVCLIQSCGRKVMAKNLCSKHWQMNNKHGNPNGGKYEMKVRKAIDHEDGTRTCSQCEQRLPISEFHKDKTATGGRRSKCKKCRIEHVKDWYQENKERQSGKEKDRRRSNVEKYTEKEALRYIKDREKRIGLATEHSHRRKARKLETVVEKGISKKALKKKFGTKCYYCKKEMDFSLGIGRKFNKDMATIEHLIPLARGGEHTWENIVLACRHCNISKNAKTIEEFEEFKKDK